MKTVFIFILLTQVALAAALAAERQVEYGQIEFEAIGKPSLLKIKGKSNGLSGQLDVTGETVTGVLKLDLKTLKTGIGLRDEHTKDKYLEVSKFPEAILVLKDQALPDVGKTGTFRGNLELHGVLKDVEGSIELKNNNKAEGKFEISLADFKVETPKYLGVTVADTVKVSVELELKP